VADFSCWLLVAAACLLSIQVLGHPYTGTKISFGFAKAFNSQQQAEAELARYPLGAVVTIYYNPSNLAEAVLERKAGSAMLGTALGIIFAILGLCIGCSLILGGLAAAFGVLAGT
jgi:hypothetical protein